MSCSEFITVPNFLINIIYFLYQVIEDIHAIWEWVLIEKLHIARSERHMYSAVLVLPETFDNRGIIAFIIFQISKYYIFPTKGICMFLSYLRLLIAAIAFTA